jgi:ABC-2 type transport system ATP-binding protein
MQDIEALAERILLIGKGTLLFDGSLETMGAAVNHTKHIHMKYVGDLLSIPKEATIIKRTAEQIIVEVDTSRIPVTDILSAFSSQVEMKDISITSPSAEELVAMMYRDFAL